MCVESQLDQSTDCIDDVLNFIEEILQENPVGSVSSVIRRIAWQGTVGNRNVEPDLSSLQTKVRIGMGCFDDEEWSALYDSPLLKASKGIFMVNLAVSYELYVHRLRMGENYIQQLVLSPIRQLIKYGEEWGQYSMRTVEWLKTESGISYRIRDTAKPLLGVMGKVSERISNYESRLARLRWHGTCGEVGDSVDEVIESVSKVSNAIPKHQGPSIKSRLTPEFGDKVVLGHLTVALVEDAVRVILEPCDNFSVKGIEVTSTPRHLCIHAL